MNVKVQNFLLKSIPYLLSIAGGLTIFFVDADEVHNSNVNDLVNNIAASLLSIPLVFLLYDYSNYLISRRVNRTLAVGTVGRINSIMRALQTTVRHIAGVRKNLSWGEFERKFATRRVSFHKSDITPAVIDQMATIRDQLDDIVYRIAHTDVLTHGQMQTLSMLGRELSRIIDQHKFRGTRGTYARHMGTILTLMGDWYDSIGGMSDRVTGPDIPAND